MAPAAAAAADVSPLWFLLDSPADDPATWLVPQPAWEASLSSALGFSAHPLRMVIAFLLAFPLASLYRRLPSVAAKHLLGAVAGVAFLAYSSDRAAYYPIATAVASYAIIRLAPQRASPWLVLAVTLVVLCFAHLRRIFVPQDLAWDFSGAQMVLTIKLSSVAFEIMDGASLRAAGPAPSPSREGLHVSPPAAHGGPASAAIAPTPNNVGVPLEALPGDPRHAKHPALRWKQERLDRAIQVMPTLLEFVGFAFFFGAVLVGPAFDYYEYTTSLTGAKYRTRPDGQRHRPSAERAYLRLIGQALGFMVAHVALTTYLPPSALVSPAFAEASSFLVRAAWIFGTMLGERCKYYFVWLMSEGACMSAGFGWVYHRALDGPGAPPAVDAAAALAGDWSGVSNVSPLAFERAQSLQQASVVWNKHTSTWLRRCVYQRVPPALGLLATYVVSAFWHGFWPGYYLFFLSAAVGQVVNRWARSRVRPWFLPGAPLAAHKRLYDWAGIAATAGYINHLAVSFVLGTVDKSVAVWRPVYYAGHVLVLVVGAAVLAVRPPRKARAAAAAAATPAKPHAE